MTDVEELPEAVMTIREGIYHHLGKDRCYAWKQTGPAAAGVMAFDVCGLPRGHEATRGRWRQHQAGWSGTGEFFTVDEGETYMPTLHRWTNQDGQEWACGASDHGPLCRLCQPVDEITRALFANVDKGYMTFAGAKPSGELLFTMTDEGNRAARDLMVTAAMEDDFDGD